MSNSILFQKKIHSLCKFNFSFLIQPIVSKELVIKCPSIVHKLEAKFGEIKRYNHEIVKAGKNEIFEMLTSNISMTVQILDEIRREPK